MSSSRPFRLLTISEAAEYLAISERSVKRLIARGDLPCIRVGSALRFAFADLEAFIARNRSGDGHMSKHSPTGDCQALLIHVQAIKS